MPSVVCFKGISQRTSLQHAQQSSRVHKCNVRGRGRLHCRAQEADQPQDPARVQQALQEAMKDPQTRARMEQMQQAMQNPEVQRQMQEMAAFMSNQSVMQRIAELREDPELGPMFEEIKSGGMPALMKFMNDPKVLAKIGEKLGDLPNTVAAQAGASGPSVMPAEPEINNLLDAARAGDVEAVEDFVAIGKDINEQDGEGRTALHYAVAYNHVEVVKSLLAESASVTVTDAQGNTALHYAAGYGRVDALKLLLDAGANAAEVNGNGKNALELVKLAPANPINQEADLLAKLDAAVTA